MKNQLQSVNLIVQFYNGLCLEIRNIYVEDTNNIAKITLADKESCLSIAFNELKKTSNLSYILSSI